MTAPQALGIYAKSSDGAYLGKKPDEDRAGRYRVQRTIAGLLYVKGAEKQERVCTCTRQRKGEKVRVMLDRQKGRAHFGGLETCSDVWRCPVCSLIITERRRAEIQAAIDAHVKAGGEVYLLTLTRPHERADELGAQLEEMRQACRYFKASGPYKRASKACGRLGGIRALEVTWGAWHGFHPHFHELVFADKGKLAELAELGGAWIDALIRAGAAERSQLTELLAHAFDVRGGDFAAEYVAKFGREAAFTSKLNAGATWGAARELTQGPVKVARLKGRTMFALVLDYLSGDAQAGQVFREYAAAIKGERQLYWSPKLRDKLGLGAEVDDDELTLEELNAPGAELVAELARDDWSLVVAHNARYMVLLWAERAGADGVSAFLAELRARPPTHNAELTRPRARYD